MNFFFFVNMYFQHVALLTFLLVWYVCSVNDIPTTNAEKLGHKLMLNNNDHSTFLNDTKLITHIQQILDRIQHDYPHLVYEKYDVPLTYISDELLLYINKDSPLDIELSETISFTPSQNVTTGIANFDFLNDKYSVKKIITPNTNEFGTDYNVYFSYGWIDLNKICKLYENIDDIQYCELMGIDTDDACGDGYILSMANMYDYENFTIFYTKEDGQCGSGDTTICTVATEPDNIHIGLIHVTDVECNIAMNNKYTHVITICVLSILGLCKLY
eukprot:200488_1